MHSLQTRAILRDASETIAQTDVEILAREIPLIDETNISFRCEVPKPSVVECQ